MMTREEFLEKMLPKIDEIIWCVKTGIGLLGIALVLGLIAITLLASGG